MHGEIIFSSLVSWLESGVCSLYWVVIWLSVSQGVHDLGAFQLVPAYPIEKEALWVGFCYLMMESETDEGQSRKRQSFRPNWESNQGPYPLSRRLSRYGEITGIYALSTQ